MKRIIFCAQKRFPRGDAGSNRILYMAKAMSEFGFDVIVISTGMDNKQDFDGTFKEYKGIKYTNIKRLDGRIGKLNSFFNSGKNTVKIMKAINVNKDDTVIIYSSFASYIKPVWRFLKKNNVSTFFDVVERQQRFQFNRRILWHSYKEAFSCYHKSGNVIAISENIKKFFEEKGCYAPVLPVFTDKDDYKAVEKRKTDKTIFIYPGNPYKKDDMKTMISAFAALSEEEKKKTEFHITSTKENTMRKILGEDYESLMNAVKDCVFVHSWLEYDELITLYEKAQFLLLARPDNVVTRANFPSKVPELMVTGTIPMVTDVGDITKYLTHSKDSFIMDNPTTVDACKNAIIKSMELNDEEIKNMSINARKTAEEKFDYRNWTETVGKIFG